MNTLTYIANKKKYLSGTFGLKKNQNLIYKFSEKARGIILSFKTIGILPTFSFLFFTRLYKQKMVNALSCKVDNDEKYFMSMNNLVAVRPFYAHSDLDDLKEISYMNYSSLGEIKEYEHHHYNFKPKFVLDIIRLVYSLRYPKRIYPCALNGSGKFTAGVILPKILKANGFITFIKETKGNSSNILADAFGICKNFEKFNFNKSDTNFFITTSPHRHTQDLKEAINSGYERIYCEKPAGISFDDLKSLREISNIKKINIAFGFNRRFAPSIDILKQTIESNNLKWHTNYFVRLAEFSESMSRFKKGGGTTVSAACHYIDLLIFLHGEIESYTVQNLLVDEVSEIDGFSFNLNISHVNKSTSTLTFLKVRPGYRTDVREKIFTSSIYDEYKITDFKKIYKNGKLIKNFHSDIKGWAAMIKYFLESKNNKNKLANLKDAINNLEISLDIDKKIIKKS